MDTITLGAANTDQLQLPLDVFQHVLLLLDDTDIARMRLACWSFRQAVDSQLRALKPLYLPPSATAAFSSCETVHAPILRYPAGSLPEADAGRYTARDVLRHFGWPAPIRNFGSILSAMQHAGELDLSGQQLPTGCISQLAQHMTRLRSLNLDACKLTKSDLVLLTAFPAKTGAEGAGLSQLSLASVRVQDSTLSTPPAQAAGKAGSTAAAGAADAAAAAAAAASDSADEWLAAGATKGLRSWESGQVLDAIATNPLTHLDIGTLKCWEFVRVAAHPTSHAKTIPAAPSPALSLLGRCSRLVPLASSLVSLKVLANPFNAQDWGEAICSRLTLLTELHMSWNSEDPKLGLDAVAFGSISQLQRLQNLRVDFTDPRGLSYEPYSLAPLAQSLTSLQLCGTNSLSLLLSVTDCANIQTLVLRHISGAAGTPEMMVQLVASLPALQELHLCHIKAPQLQRVGLCHLGDYLLSQLDCCAPQLTKLVMPDVDVNGTGIRSAAVASNRYPAPAMATVAAAAAARAGAASSSSAVQRRGPPPGFETAAPGSSSGSGRPLELSGVGALRRLQHLELDATCLMASTLPHLSCLTGLHSLTLQNMKAAQFTQACRFDCFRFVSALTSLTALNIAGDPRTALFSAEGAGGGGNNQQQQQPLPLHMPQQLLGAEFDDEEEEEDGSDSSEDDSLDESEGSEGGSDGVLSVQGEEDHEGLSSEDWQDAEGESEGQSGEDEEGEEEEEGDEDVAIPQAAPFPPPPVHQPAAAHVLPPAQQAMQQVHQLAQALANPMAALQQQQQQGQPGMGPLLAALQAAMQAIPQQQQQQQQPPLQQGDLWQLMMQPLQQQLAAAGQLAGVMPALQGMQQQQPQAAHLDLAQGLVQALQGAFPQHQNVEQVAADVLAAAGAVMGPGGGGGVNGPGGVMQLAAPRAPTSRVLEPHLHFLARLKGLVSLNLGCLRTSGPCLMHLSSLSSLQTLLLSGSISLTPSSLELLQKLRLPSVRHLSITGCIIDDSQGCPPRPTNQQLQARLEQKYGEKSDGSSSGSRDVQMRAWYVWHRDQLHIMDRLVPVLCAAFPGVELLKLGSCSKLSIVGLAGLLQQLPNLQRLWLVGPTGRVNTEGVSPVPVNFVPTKPQKQRGRGRGLGQRAEQQQQQVVGYVLPYDPRVADIGPDPPPGWQSVPQSGEELAWFVEHGVVVEPEAYSTGASGSTGPHAAGSAAAVPAGAVSLPCRAVSSLKFVHIGSSGSGCVEYAFVRYLGRMVRC